jgi:hypothetical protein
VLTFAMKDIHSWEPVHAVLEPHDGAGTAEDRQ